MMDIAVVIPAYNRAYALKDTLLCVLAQTYQPAEVWVVDDGSTDDTADCVQNLSQKFAAKHIALKYHYQKNQGVSAARNVAIQNCKSPWIAFLDSDDKWLETKLQKQVQALKNHPHIQFCHTQEIWYRNGVRVNPMKKHAKSGGWIYPECLALCAISPSSVLMHKAVFTKVGLFDETLPACEDYDLWLRITHQFEVLFLSTPLLKKFGGHEDQLSKKYWGMDRFRVYALKKMLQANVLSDEYQQLTKAMFDKKCQILLKGAKKHDNHALIETLKDLIHT